MEYNISIVKLHRKVLSLMTLFPNQILLILLLHLLFTFTLVIVDIYLINPLPCDINELLPFRNHQVGSGRVTNMLHSARLSSNAARSSCDYRELMHKLGGCLFNIYSGEKNVLIPPHPLDTNRSELFRVIKNDVIPACQNIVPKSHKMHSRIGQMLDHANPGFDIAWNFTVEIIYRTLTPESYQTKENMKLMRILRAAADFTFAWTTIIDDIVDESRVRMGKPAWHTVCEGGIKAAYYDTMFMCNAPSHLTTCFFRDRPGYDILLESFSKVNTKGIVGQNMDYLGQGADGQQDYESIVAYKSGSFFQFTPTLALIHAGILDRKVITQMEEIWHQFGVMFQAWDDFTDMYCAPELTGKPAKLDVRNANSTRVSTMAYNNFNESQRKIFKEIYGSDNPIKVARLGQLYEEINLPMLYIRYMQDKWNYCSSAIDKLPDAKLKEAASSYMNWLIGGVKDVC